MKKQWFALTILLSFINLQPVFCASYTIKTHDLGGFDLSASSALSNALLSSSNFGTGGIVEDVEFTFTYANDFSAESLADADIFIAGFSAGSTRVITAAEAQNLKNFVNSGKSLFVVADYAANSVASATLVGSLFGGVTFVDRHDGNGTSTITDRTSFPQISDGPFGAVNSLGWFTNAVAYISELGDSISINSENIFSIIAPTATTGAVIFYDDMDSFSWAYASGDIQPLALNMFTYAATGLADGSVVVPEPASIILLGLALGCVRSKKIIK